MTLASPLRGPKSSEGGGFAAAHPSGTPRMLRGRPPAPRVLRIALRATALRAALDPGDRCGPWEQEKRAGPGPPPLCARHANPAVAGHGSKPNVRTQVNWRSIVARNGKLQT